MIEAVAAVRHRPGWGGEGAPERVGARGRGQVAPAILPPRMHRTALHRQLPIWIALLLLLMQQLGLQHGVSHLPGVLAALRAPAAAAAPAGAPPAATQPVAAPYTLGELPSDAEAGPHACMLCLAHAALGPALLPAPPVLAAISATLALPRPAVLHCGDAAGSAYWARGPPLSLS